MPWHEITTPPPPGMGATPYGIAAEAEVDLLEFAEVGLIAARHGVAVLVGGEHVRTRDRDRARILADRLLVR